MSKHIFFQVVADPVAQPRPKVSTRGGIARAYVPASHPSHALKAKIREAYKQAGGEMLEGPVVMLVTCGFALPKSKAARKGKGEHHTQKPDCDNLAKLVMDALNGLAYKDDGQVASLHINKRWGESGRVAVGIESMQSDEAP